MDWLQNTKRFRLNNGLTILTHRLPNSEVAALHFCVKAGYFCETDSEVGLAHLLEHMYFKGSRHFPDPGTLGIKMKALGGSINATTSYDQTNYFCEVPAENLFPAIEIMADAFLEPLFPEDELRREIEVVIEEFNRKIDSPSAYSLEKLIQIAFTTHRMKRWRIGTPEQLRSYTRKNLLDYFHRYYQPQNMIVTVTGRFQEDFILEKLSDWTGRLPAGTLVKDFGPAEPPQQELRYGFYKALATQSYLYLGFHAPGVLHPDQPAMDFLSSLLSGGKSGRLHRYLVEQRRSASSVSTSLMNYEDIGLFVISAVTESKNIRQASSDSWTVLQDLYRNGIAEPEVQKVKNRLELHQVMQTQDALSLAQLLSYYEAYGGYEKISQYMEAMKQLQEEQILTTAKKYLTLENLSVLEYVNEEIPASSAKEYTARLGQSCTAPEWIFFSPPPVIDHTEGLGSPHELVTPIIRKGKVHYIFLPDPHMPFLAGGIFFLGGRNEESPPLAGITHMLFRMVLKGTSRWNAEDLAFRFDTLGNPPRFSTNRDISGFLFEALPGAFMEMWNLLIHCLADCCFPEKELETEKGKVISIIRRNMDDNFIRPMQLFLRAFYGDHPYGLPETGFEMVVSSFSSSDLKNWKNRLFQHDRILVSVAGSFDPERMFTKLESSLSVLPATGPSLVPPLPVVRPVRSSEIEYRPKKQTAFVLGFPAPKASLPEVHQYECLQQVLNGMGGRLFLNLRSKKSLAYTVFAGLASHLYSGTFQTYIAGEAGKEQKALEAMWQELEILKDTPVSMKELENARNALIGSYILNTQTAVARIANAVNNHILGRPIPFAPVYRDLLQQVRVEDLMSIAAKTFCPEKASLGIIRGTTEMTEAEKMVLV